MTDEEQRRFEEYVQAHPYGDQDENGIDLSLLRANLKLTPLERLENLERSAQWVRELDEARNKARKSARN